MTSMFTRSAAIAATVAAACGLATSASAQADGQFNGGNLVVSVVTPGSPASAAAAVSLREFTTSGVAGDVVNFATTGPSAFTNSGSATAGEGTLTLATDGQSLSIGGYNTPVGTASVTGTQLPRLVNRVGLDLSVSTAATFTTAFDTFPIRSTLIAGNTVWAAGNGSTSTTLGGLRNIALGDTGPGALQASNLANVNVVNAFNNEIYASFRGTAGQGIFKIVGGVAQPFLSLANATGATRIPNDFVIASSNLVFVADEFTPATGGAGGLQVWFNNGTTWALSGVVSVGAGSGLRGLARDAATGAFYGTTTDNRLVRIDVSVDPLTGVLAAGSTVSTLATAPAGTLFRGVEVIPSPGTIALLSLGGLVATRRKR